MDIKFEKTTAPKAKPADESKLGFGKVFSDHMFIMEYDPGQGWHDARIVPFQNLSLHPASPVLHYAQEVFEGAKAYRRADGEIQAFRLMENCKRMARSAERSCMACPTLDEMHEGILRLVDVDRDWVPSTEGTSLYLRPTLIGDGDELGAHSASRFIFYVICAPSGAYYANGLKPVRIRIEERYVRAVKGGMGFAKTGGNYCASFKATKEAGDVGYDQVLWLDGIHRRYIQEVGAMNMMFVMDGKLVTPDLGDTILPGITRDSILTLAREMGMTVEEREIPVDELFEAHASGRLSEAFGTGTAAVVSPVGEFGYKDQTIIVNNREIGPVAQKFYDTLTGIQFGKTEDKHGWTEIVKRY